MNWDLHVRKRLTINAQVDPFADDGRYSVGGDAQVHAHIQAAHLVQIQRRSFNLQSYQLKILKNEKFFQKNIQTI